ncbi:MAG: transporter permease [Acidobacteriota bacterium]|nr:transporter permease [Acidobacteriota bacterium]
MTESYESQHGDVSNLELTRYTPESRIRHPISLLKEMWHDLKASRELAWRLFIRDISAQYRQTALGYFWAIFPPLVSSMVFILLRSSTMIDARQIGVGIPYPAYVMMGATFYYLFVDALNAPLKVITESKMILTKINLPREALILSAMGDALFSFTIKCILLVGIMIYYGVSVYWTVIFLPIPLIGLLLMGTMVGVLLIPLGLLYKDVQSALMIATSGLIFLTPVAYLPSTQGTLGHIMRINPITPLLMGAKDLVIRGIPEDLPTFFLVFGLTLGFLFIGWIIYRLALPIIIERIGA